MDIYKLINSKAVSEHCRKINHQFNTEEIAVLIYRNKKMDTDEKIKAYEELLADYPDMKVIERFNCKSYDSVKDMIRGEIERIKSLIAKLLADEQDVVYSYNYYCSNNQGEIREGKNEYRDIYKTFKEVKAIIDDEIKDDEQNEILSFTVTKRTVSQAEKHEIKAEYYLDENKNLKMANIYDYATDWLDISNICLNIPTPFKKGDLLVSNSKTPFSEGHVLNYDRFPFVLDCLCMWNDGFEKRLAKGCYDSSDMQGPGYMVREDDGMVYRDNIFDYDSWEYFEGNLEGYNRILKGLSNLLKGKISIELFLAVYEEIRTKNKYYLRSFTKDGLMLAGLNEEDIKDIK